MISLTKTVLKRPIAVIVLVAGLIIFGISSILAMPLQLTPDMEMPMLAVVVTYPQAGPEDVDELITKKVEDELGTLSGLDTVFSYSAENVSQVVFKYEYGTDIDDAFMDMKEALDSVKSQLPDDAKDPMIFKMDMNAQPIMEISITGEENFDTYEFVEETLKPELEKISTVAKVETNGGKEEYISVELNPELVNQYKLDISSISKAVANARFTTPAGSADHGSAEISLSTKQEYKTPEQIRNIPITTSMGKMIHLSDVAYVHYASKTESTISRYNGESDIQVSISKEQSASAVTVAKAVNSALDKIKAENPNAKIEVTYDSSETIVSSIKAIFETMILGVICTMLVLFLFFGDLKGSFIVACSMPISLLLTFILMAVMGFSLNLVTMGSLVIAIGMMVDNAIVVIEMCFQKRDEGMDFFEAPLAATKTVLNSIVASTITTIVVYIPLATMKGLSGQMFAQLGYTIVFAMIASLICAITVVPLCYSKFKPIEKKNSLVNRTLNVISEKYASVLVRALRHKLLVSIIAIAIFIATVFLAQFLNMELMSQTDEGQVEISLTFKPGTRLELVDEKVKIIEQYISESPYIDGFSIRSSAGSGTVSAYISDSCKLSTQEIADEWNKDLQSYADGFEIKVGSTQSMGMTSGGGGNSYDVTYESRDLSLLKESLNEVADVIRNVDGVISVSSSYGSYSVKADIIVDPIKATANNISPQAVANAIYTVMNGSKAMEVTNDGNKYDVKIEYPKDEYETINDVYSISLTNSNGQPVALQDVAEIVLTDSPETIMKEDGWYNGSISAQFDSSRRFEVQESINKAVATYIPPVGVQETVNTMDEMMQDEFTAIIKAIITAILLIYMVMAIEFENLRYSGMVMFCIPFALIGSIALLLITQATISMVSLMGFLMLIGIVVNNGILYVDFTNQLRAQGMHTTDALIATGQSRLRPILMTTLTTILSMVPMGLGLGKNGDMMKGMALVIIGGLIASTILTLLLLPTFYMIIHKKPWKNLGKGKNKKAAKKEAKELERQRYNEQLNKLKAKKETNKANKQTKKKAVKSDTTEAQQSTDKADN